MLQALLSLGQNQFEPAYWAEKEPTKTKYISVEPIGDQERRFNSVIQNLITSADSTLIRTSYAYDYKPRQHMFYLDKWWEILSVSNDPTAVNPQSLSLVKRGARQFIIELGEADGYDAE